LAFLNKLQQLVYDSAHNKGFFFEAFILIFMAKKAYLFLFDRIESSTSKKSASDVFKQLNDELEKMVSENKGEIQQGLSDVMTYLHHSFLENETLLETMQADMERLPYQACESNETKAHSLVSLSVDTAFSYQEIIDPVELAGVEQRVRQRKSDFEHHTKDIADFVAEMATHFDLIAEVQSNCNAGLSEMVRNKRDKLGETFTDAVFVLSVFHEEEQDEYLKKHKQLLEEIQLEIEHSLDVELRKLIKTIVSTEMLTKSTSEILKANPGLNFLLYKDQLSQKRHQFQAGISTLNTMLEEINRLPQEKAEIFAKKMATWLGVSVLPLGNLGAMIPIHTTLKAYEPAIASDNSAYVAMKQAAAKKFQIFLYVHIVLAVISGVVSIPVDSQKKPFLYGLASTYFASAGFIFLKQKQLKSDDADQLGNLVDSPTS
jgi:hypothetical protein